MFAWWRIVLLFVKNSWFRFCMDSSWFCKHEGKKNGLQQLSCSKEVKVRQRDLGVGVGRRPFSRWTGDGCQRRFLLTPLPACVAALIDGSATHSAFMALRNQREREKESLSRCFSSFRSLNISKPALLPSKHKGHYFWEIDRQTDTRTDRHTDWHRWTGKEANRNGRPDRHT